MRAEAMVTSKPQNILLSKLRLDPENPRFLQPPPTKTQNGLLAFMLDDYKGMDLARKIAAEGYVALENIIVQRTPEGHFQVLEGNRRIAACIGLKFPGRGPKHLQRALMLLSKQLNHATIRSIPAIVVGSRVEAFSLLAAKHSQSEVLKWETVVQSEFFLKAIHETGSIEDAAEALNTTPGRLREGLRLSGLWSHYKKIRGAPALSTSEIESAFATTLERFFRTDEIKEFAILEITDTGSPRVTFGAENLAYLLPRLVEEILADRISSRNTNDSESRRRWLNKLMQDRPGGSPTSEGTMPPDSPASQADSNQTPTTSGVNAGSEPPSQAQPAGAAPETGDKKPKIGGGVFGLPERTAKVHPNVDAVYDELRATPKLRKWTAALLLRCLLELALYEKMRSSGELAAWEAVRKAEFAKKNAKRKAEGKSELLYELTSPTLYEMLAWIVSANSQLLTDPATKRALSHQIKEEAVITTLNLAAHSTAYHLTLEKVLVAGADLRALILNELMS